MCECLFAPLCQGTITDEECSVCDHYSVLSYDNIGVGEYEEYFDEWFNDWSIYCSEYTS